MRDGLQKVRELLSDPKRWCKKHYHRDENGKEVSRDDPRAVAHCLYGALRKCGLMGADVPTLRAAWRRRGYSHEEAFNDNPKTTHEDVLAALDEAIAACA